MKKRSTASKVSPKKSVNLKVVKPPVKKDTKTKLSVVKKTTKAKTTKKVLTNKALANETLLAGYREMLKARLIDEKTIVLYKQNKCHFQIGVAGHECIQVATAMVMKPAKDWFYPYYREMALVSALGQSPEDLLLNAMNKPSDPNSHGRQMPMHYGDVRLNIVNQSSPTGSQFLQAVGCAVASKIKGLKEVTYVSAGEGACAQGDFHEAVNWAARDKLPVIFMVQNNGYAISVPQKEQLAANVSELTSGYTNLKRLSVDGTDFVESLKIVQEAYDYALSGKGPSLVEAFVPRLQSHSISDNQLKYRSEAEIKADQQRCPIYKLGQILTKKKILKKAQLENIYQELKDQIDLASEWAEVQVDHDPASAADFTWSDPTPTPQQEPAQATGEEIYMVDAINHALDEELEHNEDMYIFGQDVAHGKGGVFTVTAGLTAKYGSARVFNAQLAESSIAGVAIGMATRGLKPVVEIQFGDYIWTAMNQIRNELAMLHYRSGGDFSCPAVIRVPVGGYIHGGTYHSQSIEATFAHFPGLYVVMPSNATDAKGLLKSAIRCNNPVLFLEHKGLYRQVYAKGKEGDADYLTPFGKARIVKEGKDLTIITYGFLVQKSLMAAQELEEQGVSVEVIDLRSIVPLDQETIFESVKKCGRVIVAHEDVTFVGFGAEIAALIADQCFEYLDAPIKRIGMVSSAAIPHSTVLEPEILPQTHQILATARDLLSF